MAADKEPRCGMEVKGPNEIFRQVGVMARAEAGAAALAAGLKASKR
jgi:hypothetical protein